MNRELKKAALLLSLAGVALAGVIVWRIAACYIANAELESDMKFLSQQMGMKSGLSDPLSEDQLRDAVIAKAKEDGIDLNSGQVTAEKSVTDTQSIVNLSANYDGKIDLFVFTFRPHFSPSASGTAALAPAPR